MDEHLPDTNLRDLLFVNLTKLKFNYLLQIFEFFGVKPDDFPVVICCSRFPPLRAINALKAIVWLSKALKIREMG